MSPSGIRGELRVVAGKPAQGPWVLAPGQRVVLGRGHDADVPVHDESASRRHAEVALDASGRPFVTDLGSKNGTLLDEERLPPEQARPARSGSVVGIGEYRLRIDVPGGAPGGGRLRDDYEHEGELGRGAAGVVYAARHRASGRAVAIKALPQPAGDDPGARGRALREARVRIDSPHVVRVAEVREEDDCVYIVMERVEGRSARELVRDGPLPVPAALRIAEEVARGLAAAHTLGVVHRDVKPANVLVTPDGAAKLADFGIAKVAAASASLTASGQGIGTLTYVAPEQAEDAKRVSPAADLYGLGATTYHLLAGRPPFDPGPNLVLEIFEEEPAALRRLRKETPPPVAALVHRLLEKEPEDRPGSAEEVADALARLRGGP